MKEIILASQSPRRKELLEEVGLRFRVEPAQIEEHLDESLPITQAIEQLAKEKAMPIARRHPQCIVIGADTLVAVDGLVLGKPADEADAARMLRMAAVAIRSSAASRCSAAMRKCCFTASARCASSRCGKRRSPHISEAGSRWTRPAPMASRGWAVCSSKASAEIISTSWACRYPGSCARLINFHDTGRDLCVFFPTKFERCRLGKLSKTVYNRRGEFWKNKEVRRR